MKRLRPLAFLLCASLNVLQTVNAQTAATVCTVDTSQSPQMAEFAKQLPALCQSNYALIKSKLITDDFKPPAKIRLVFKDELPYPAQALGDEITLSSKWFTEHPDDLGAVVHEMAHVAQAYPPGRPHWLTEGLADYIRYWRGYKNAWSYPHCGQGSEHYTSGYWCSAAFLQFVERDYDRMIVGRLNKALRVGVYEDALFRQHTGRTVEQLWADCLKKDCKGGRP